MCSADVVRAMMDQVRFLPVFLYQRVRAGEDGGCGRITLERRRDIVMDRSDPREAIAWTILFAPC